jgi:Zn-dependent alcohol dehydrogenase
MVRLEQQQITSRKFLPVYSAMTVLGNEASGIAPDIQVAVTRIRPGSVVSIHLFSHQTLVCRKGRLWITRSGDTADYWLAPGETLQFSKACRLVVEADGMSAFALHGSMHAAKDACSQIALLTGWLQRAVFVLRNLAHV